MNRPPLRSRGFTLVELLTVIGIIVVLVALLLPVVGKVRTAAMVSATQQQVATIAGAIERYRAEQGGYPGLFLNAQFNASGILTPALPVDSTKGGGSAALTQTEAMVLSLCGGPEAIGAGTDTTFQYNPDLVGRGANSLGPNVTRRKRFPAYVDPTPGSMVALAGPPGTLWSITGITVNDPEVPGTPPSTADSRIPEFLDRFPIQRPILYARANVGGIGITTLPAGITTGVPQYPAGTGGTVASFLPYKRGAAPGFVESDKGDTRFPGDFNFNGGYVNKSYASMNDYLKHPTIGTIPRGKDAFVLISAGPDNTFGSKDDIIHAQ